MTEKLPSPRKTGSMSVEQAIEIRRSVREFTQESLDMEAISQLLWSTYGLTGDQGLRAAPSAGAFYPLELYVATADGLYQYDPASHTLSQVKEGDLRPSLREHSLDQACVTSAPAVFVFTAIYERTCAEYGGRGRMYVHMDVGHAAQNLLLQAVALRLAGVPIGAFSDREVAQILRLRKGERPLYLIPVGQPRNSNPN